ncbi:hypothetical protein F0919_10015 [Taibaiella lutea]|uniref:Uncharacterized protein n=1 Tax=Taibaiella lutea TaxID=2608001 RepID=A0A5M6CNS6_9BACT|nr:hypothetical protein [Taibaiella lutea]KAA5534925.1 hypothetical protein F0919_10015 [Taibaiella lutea]
MQICFRLKYESEHYQPIPASSGDCGIEGFTKTGKVFQCYCPDNNITSTALYEKQRDKITRDLGKLSVYVDRLGRFLNGVKIKEWIFVTPEYRMNDLILHCNNKKKELLDSNLNIIDPSFQVLIHDIDNFIAQIPIALNSNAQKLTIGPDITPVSAIITWREQEIDLVGNAIRKHNKRFSDNPPNLEDKVNQLTEATIKSYFDRESILRRWQNLHPQDYDRYLTLISQIEEEVTELCMFPTQNNNQLYLSFRTLVKERLKDNFAYLDETTITTLMNGAIADWLLRCPLDFE